MDKTKLPTVSQVVDVLERECPAEDRIYLRILPSEQRYSLHHGFGTYIRNRFIHGLDNHELLADARRLSPDMPDLASDDPGIWADGVSHVIIDELLKRLRAHPDAPMLGGRSTERDEW